MKERSFSSSSIYSVIRGTVIVLSLIGIAVSVGRCGPVASSLNKNQAFQNGLLPGGGPGTTQGYVTTVVAAEEFGLLPTTSVYNLTEGAGSQLETFRTQGQVQLNLGNQQVPTNGFIVVTWSRGQISNEIAAFKTTYTPVSQGVWLLAVDPVVPANVSQDVRQQMTHVRLWFGQ